MTPCLQSYPLISKSEALALSERVTRGAARALSYDEGADEVPLPKVPPKPRKAAVKRPSLTPLERSLHGGCALAAAVACEADVEAAWAALHPGMQARFASAPGTAGAAFIRRYDNLRGAEAQS